MSRFTLLGLALLLPGLLACGAAGSHDHDHAAGEPPPAESESHSHGPHAAEEEGWAVTAWGDHFEIFAEADPLVAGETAASHTHVTLLEGFSPLTRGTVTALLRPDDGSPPQAFRQEGPARDGIFNVELRPAAEGLFDLSFQVEVEGLSEEIPAGRVRVGRPGEPGGLVEEPGAGPATGGEPVDFLKEQQWRTAFATALVRPGSIHRSVRGPGKVQPPAGGERVLTAPADGVVQGDPWPHPGLAVRGGEPVFQVAPQVAPEHSLAELEAELAGLTAQAEVARKQSRREEELLGIGATSVREAEEARAHLATLEARLDAARRDLESARVARRGVGRPAELLPVRAPFAGRVAAVRVSAGETVAAGAPLARLVKSEPVWLEVALSPGDAAAVTTDPAGLVLTTPGAPEPLVLAAGTVRLVAHSPEVDPATGTVAVLLEVDRSVDELRIGSAVEAELLLAGEREGIVIPASAVVDDSGVSVVYLQTTGESFVRRELEVVARQGDRLLVTGLAPGQRLVTRGGGAIRRTALLASGPVEAHQH